MAVHTQICRLNSATEVKLLLRCFDSFYYDEDMKKKNVVFVLNVACGGETAPTAGGNCSYSTVTAVIISSCSVSGSFHHQAGCIYIGHD